MFDNFNQISNENLNKNNHPMWKFWMTKFLEGKNYSNYIVRDNERPLIIPQQDPTIKQQKFSKLAGR